MDSTSPVRLQPLDELLLLARSDPPACLASSAHRVWVVCGIAEALQTAHADSRIHGALLPMRILVSPQGQVRIIGWEAAADAAPSPYRAPECAAGQPASPAGDMYALGAIMWEMLTLRPPLVVEENLTRFHRRKRSGDVDPLPGEVRCLVPEDLLAIARKAMAPDPALRWQDMGELLTALHGWLHRLESVAITLQAERELAVVAKGAGEPAHAAGAFHSALALWPGNPAAQEGASASEAAQALAAIRNGDVAAAEDHAGQVSGIGREMVTAEFSRLRQQRSRRRIMQMAGILIVILAIVATAWILHRSSAGMGVWRRDSEWVLSQTASTTGLEMSLYRVDEHLPLPDRGPDGLALPANHTIWLKDIDGRGDLRFGVEAVWPKEIDGFELMFSAPRIQPPVYHMTQPGYSCQFGGFRGTQTFLSSSPEAGWPSRPVPIPYHFDVGRTYRLEMERHGEHLRLSVDGNVIWDQREVVPVGDSSFRWLAFRAWTQMTIRRVWIDRPRTGLTEFPLSTADALAGNGHHADALAAYEAALRLPLTERQRHQAIAKGHLVASRLPDRRDQRRALLRLANQEIPDTSPYRLDVLQAEAQSLWRDREWQQALVLVRTAQSRHPDARIAHTLIERRQDGVPRPVLQALLELVASGPAISHLDLPGMGITDLAALKGMRIESLNISGNAISDLSPLAGMKLRALLCANNLIHDLGPLRGMPLVRLDATGNRISDLAPLAGAPIEHLYVIDNRIADLSPLAGMSTLVRLRADRNPIASLAPLAGCTRLEQLEVGDAPLSSLESVPLGALLHLSVRNCPVTVLSPLRDSRLVGIDLSGTRVRDASPLPRGSVAGVTLARTPLDGLASLRGLTLATLDLSDTAISDLAGIDAISFRDHASLILDGCRISSLAPLAAGDLGLLSLRATNIADLSILAGRTIRQLKLDGSPVADLSIIPQIAGLRLVSLWRTASTPAAQDALADRLEQILLPPDLVEQVRIHAALNARDWRRLRAMARRIGAYDRLPLQIELPCDRAASLAASASARLPCILDQTDLYALSGSPLVQGWYWSGLQPRKAPDAIPIWSNGRFDPHLSLLIRPQADMYQGAAWVCPNAGYIEPMLIPMDEAASLLQQRHVILEW